MDYLDSDSSHKIDQESIAQIQIRKETTIKEK